MKLTATKRGIRLIPKTKRESFLPSDKAWLESKPVIEPGEYIGRGMQGAVYTVKGKPNMIVKIPVVYKNTHSTKNLTPSERRKYMQEEGEEDEINEEWRIYESLSLEEEPLIIPTKSTRVTGDKVKGSFPGLVRPRVKVIGFGKDAREPTDAEIEQIRQKLIALSARGITLVDGLQVGADRTGRVQLFDLGFIEDRSPKCAAQKNQLQWEMFLRRFGKDIEKYGMVNPSGRGNAKYFS